MMTTPGAFPVLGRLRWPPNFPPSLAVIDMSCPLMMHLARGKFSKRARAPDRYARSIIQRGLQALGNHDEPSSVAHDKSLALEILKLHRDVLARRSHHGAEFGVAHRQRQQHAARVADAELARHLEQRQREAAARAEAHEVRVSRQQFKWLTEGVGERRADPIET